MLRVSLLGNLGGDPEVRYNQKGTQLVSFRVAVNQVRTGPDGERQESTEWFRVRVPSRQSEFAQRLGKGSRVLVIGRLDISRYTAKDGEVRTGFDVWADEIQGLALRGGSEPYVGGGEAEREAAEPALAGVASVSGAPGQARRNTTSGVKDGRPSAKTEGGTAEASSDDLEDLPF